MTGRPLSFVLAERPASVLRAIADVAPLAGVAAGAPVGAWRSGGPGHWTLDAAHAGGGTVRIIVHEPGALELHDAQGVRFFATVDGIPDAPPSRLPATALTAVDALVRAGAAEPPDLEDWFAVAAALHRRVLDPTCGGRLVVDLAGPLSPSAIREVGTNPLMGRGGPPRRAEDAATALLDAACPIACRAHPSRLGDRWTMAIHPPSAFCDAGTGHPTIAGVDPVGLLRAFARVRAAGGVA